MKYRFLEALNDFLSAYGRDDLINSQLDCHSTIQLDLESCPPINIDLATNDIIIWSNIADYNPSYVEAVSASLLNQLITYSPRYFMAGQPALNIVDSTLVLSAVMKEEALTYQPMFAGMLEEFYERCNQLRTLFSV